MQEEQQTIPVDNSGKSLALQALAHLSVFLAAAAVFVTFDSWSARSGLGLATFLAAVSAIVAGLFLSQIFHEWGHFVGAKLAGATTTIKASPAPLFFDFDYVDSSPRQYLWLSDGGPAGNLLIILLTVAYLPLDSFGRELLLASMIGSLVFVLFLELPVSQGIRAGKPPMEVMMTHFGQGEGLFRRCAALGIVAGLVSLLVI